MIKKVFIDLIKTYTDDNDLAEELWSEIEKAYSNKKRHYHTLSHLENLLSQLTLCKEQISDWNCILFSVFYHDAVYNALKKDNEEKSAELAGKRMGSINVPAQTIEKCKAQILATKSHQSSDDNDTNLFTDADLSALGQDWNSYLEYCQQIRKEYSIYPDLMYNPGRKKVLLHFLAMKRIYKTDFFFNKYEANAKKNLEREINEVLK
jgi:predicted metal-dependent HD superfamily phosphohydrolase